MSWEAGGYSQQFPFPVIQTERGKISGHFFFPWAIALSEQAVAFPKSLLERNGKNISVKYHYKVVQPWIGTDAFASLCPEEKLQVFLLTSHFPGHFQSCFPLRPWRVRSWVSKLSTARLSLEENMKNVIQMVNCKQKKKRENFQKFNIPFWTVWTDVNRALTAWISVLRLPSGGSLPRLTGTGCFWGCCNPHSSCQGGIRFLPAVPLYLV